MRRASFARVCRRGWSSFCRWPGIRRPRFIGKSRRGLAFRHDEATTDITEGWKNLDRSVGPVDSFRGGTSEALRLLDDFVKHKLASYPENHGKPEIDGTSRLSPYLHFGHIGPHTVMKAVQESKAPQAAKDDYINQFLTWRELAINFVHFNPVYDSLECAPDWAHKTLAAHAGDPRPSSTRASSSSTPRPTTSYGMRRNSQMLHAGWMHNYMRMYWAKKILEWSPSPAVAYQTALYLNDKYFLDGRDPDGYAGVAWAIGGKFDRPWFERPIFGTIRWMSGDAARKKFDADKYIAQMNLLAGKKRAGEQATLFPHG